MVSDVICDTIRFPLEIDRELKLLKGQGFMILLLIENETKLFI